jgi:predicted O-methyltransferase YrrM
MKNSDSEQLREMCLILRSKKLELPPEALERIHARRTELTSRLTGEVCETSYRHEVQKLDGNFVCQNVSSNETACALLYLLIRISGAERVLELGSAFGLGSLAAVLALAPNSHATFDGIEYEEWRAIIASEGVQRVLGERATVHPGRIEEVLPVLAGRGNRRQQYDFAFIDAMHTREATMGYHRLLLDTVCHGAIVVYDDINWSNEMMLAWRDIVASSEVTGAVLVNHRWGVAQYRAKAWNLL